MNSIKKYFSGVFFTIRLALKFAPILTISIATFYAISSVVSYGGFYVLGKIVTEISKGISSNSSSIFNLVLLYVFINMLPNILGNIRRYLNRKFNLEFSKELDLFFLTVRERVDIAVYEAPKFQDLLQRTFRNGLGPIYNLVSGQFNFLWNVTSFIVGTILVLKFSPIVYFVIILSAIPGFIIDIKFASRSWSIWSTDSPDQRRYADLRQHFTGKVSLTETKLLQSKEKMLVWIRKILTDFKNKHIKNEKKRIWAASIGDFIAYAGLFYGLYVITTKIGSVGYTVGSIVYIIGVINRMKDAINSLLVDVSVQYEDALIVNDMKQVVETKPIIIDVENPQILSLKSAPEIVFENVGFKYPNSDKWSLRNINITFNAGDNIGLVGNNGAGKTTLVKLLCRIYDPTEGRILINGIDLKEVATKEWWSYLAVMFQDYASYDFIVEEAIAIGKPEKQSNLTKVIEAAKVSQAHEFIMDWEGKYNQQLGVEFGGKEPSKGQRQKLSIAKILYRNSPVMILDEPTASVDAESEAKIFDTIENLSKDQTAILISHDFSTISQCDKIFVLDKGELIEEGTHKELMKNKGLYSELYKLQADRFKK